ncbi:MAG: ABC transporter ATP-binding protein [Phycisphaerae bacterium]|nr:MAG: ABC transporter ATP-binding protein [Planctomycetia bacterium]RIK67536.1 MAG: ABC transporter [Planctomycetota bacterium]GJQ24981.1 MAG: ABC transporter ATP-binding protein [Phycisphaerae bacterium]
MDDRTIIEARGLSFSYDRHAVLDGVDLTIGNRDFISIVGPNGGGKTTLLKLFLGLLRPTRGEIRVFGVSPEKARPRIGYMPQHTRHDLEFPVNVLDVVLMGRHGTSGGGFRFSRSDRETAVRSLGDVGLADLARRPFAALSGGQRQRVLIARALACEPELLLLDEPTSNLDLRVQDDFYELLRRLSARHTVILVSHDVAFVSKLVNRVICVNRGATVHTTSELRGKDLLDLYGPDVCMVRHDHS